MIIKEKFKEEEMIADMPNYRIYMVNSEGWYVINKIKKSYKFFDFKVTKSYLTVLEYAMNI